MKPLFTLMLLALSGLLSAQTPADGLQVQLDSLKTLLTTSPGQADELADYLLKGKNKKNAPLLVSIARIYHEAGLQNKADAYVAQARKADAKCPALSVLEGDMALAREDVGAACQLYEQAIYFDPHCREAYLKYAQAYRTAAPELSIEKLLQLKSVAPDYKEADRALAQVYYSINRFGNAIECYAAFIDTPLATEDDLLKYAFALFLNHDFEHSLSVARRGSRQNPSHAAFHRLMLYNNVDLRRYAAADSAARLLFAPAAGAEHSYLDHRYYGTLLAALQQYDQAIEQFRCALACDSTQHTLWLDLSTVYEQRADYPQAISAYLNYYQTLPPTRQTPEQLFQLGRLYYGQGTAPAPDSPALQPADSLQRREALLQADSIFTLVDQLVPTSYLGDLWRARANSALDPETIDGLAKPHYEAVVATLLPKADARYNAALVECYSYLGYYYLLKNDYPSSTDYWEKILLLDPNNGTAGKALEGIRQQTLSGR
ncbi:MAG: hypothetical protein IJ494_04300 [Bacteroides sp.]|nr:hypothetical protein [Bacteroides sp.]